MIFTIVPLTHANQINAQSNTEDTVSLQEGIHSFHSDIQIQENGDIIITETLEFFAPSPRHGIYRQIPFRYNRDGWRFTAQVRDVRVRADGRSVPVEQTADGAFLTLKIGDPITTFTGPKTYTISYRVDHAIQAHSDSPETPQLYWDIVGESWRIPVFSTSATITSPNEITLAECFSGAYGKNNFLCTITASGKTAELTYPKTIYFGDNVTAQISLDSSGPVQAPTPLQTWVWWLKDNWALFFAIGPVLFFVNAYRKKGRDWWYGGNIHTPNTSGEQKQYWPWNLPTVPFIYEPPKELTPGEASFLVQEQFSQEAVTAEILDLARKKLLTIERRKKNEYWFKKKINTKQKISAAQQVLLDGIFATGDEVSLKDLSGKLSMTMHKVGQEIEKQLVEKNLIQGRTSYIRTGWIFAAIGVNAVILVGALNALSPFVPMLLWPLFIFSTGLSLACAWAMPSRTAVGSNLAWKMKGLSQTISRGKWREEIKEKNLFVEEVLPFAVAFGVVRQLTKDLKDLHLKPPEYAQALVQNGLMQQSLVNSFRSQSKAGFSAPSSSSSGWSGGGGSSGGGGGGGGGGSW